jgi:chaperonin GroES
MDLAMQAAKEKNFPWPGCSNVVFPLVTIAALQFSARSYSSIIQGTNVVRYRVIGKVDMAAHERAFRIGKHMSWQVLEEDLSWEEQHDRLLINLAIVGSAFVKTYWDAGKGYVTADLVMAKDLVIDYYAKSVESAARKSHLIPMYRNEVYERIMGDTFTDVREETWWTQAPAGAPKYPSTDRRLGLNPPPPDDYTPFHFIEQHTWFDLDGDGYQEPYIATCEFNSHRPVRLVARIENDSDIEKINGEVVKIKAQEYFTKYSFIPSPDGGIYDLGFGIFLGPINEAVSSGINQLIDLGTVQNSNGGFLGRGAKIRGGVYTIAPYEWKRVDSTGDDLRKNIVPFPEKNPNEVMFKLIGLLIEYANRIAGTVDATVGENPGQNTPASTYQGMTEQGMQVYSMIFKRVWRCMKEEFKRRYELNRVYTRSHEDFGSGKDFIRREDYLGNPDQVAPVANPRITSTVMRVQQAIAVKQDSMATAGYDIAEVTKEFLESLEVEGIERMYPGPGNVKPGHEMKNPKVAQQEIKVQELQMKLKEERLRWAHELLEQQRLNNAKIRLAEAQALKAASDANATDAATKLEAYNQLIETHDKFNDMVNERIKALLGEASGEGGEASDQAGVRRVENKPGDAGGTQVSVKVSNGSDGAMGSR